jgi:hypothetical protein
MWGVRLRSAVEWKSAVPIQVPVPGSSPNGKGSSRTNRLKTLGSDSARNALQDVAFTWRRVSWPRHPPKVRFGYANCTGPFTMLARVDQVGSTVAASASLVPCEPGRFRLDRLSRNFAGIVRTPAPSRFNTAAASWRCAWGDVSGESVAAKV